jgi:hypothetical protein
VNGSKRWPGYARDFHPLSLLLPLDRRDREGTD